MIYFLKNTILLFFNSSSSITYILLNNSNIAYFWHNVFNKLNQTLILMGCREYLLKFCVCVWYHMMLVLLKWNGKMVVKWRSDQFWRYCSCIYVLIETEDAVVIASATRAV